MNEILPDKFANAVICMANNYQFGPAGRRHFPQVQSRMCLWCKAGHGQIKINNKTFSCHPYDYFILPWNHTIKYLADREEPFLLAGIHIIPYQDPQHPLIFDVAHHPQHELTDCNWRKDVELEGLEETIHFKLTAQSSLLMLSEYIIKSFAQKSSGKQNTGMLAQILLHEIIHTASDIPTTTQTQNKELNQLLQYINNHLTQRLVLEDLAALLNCSNSTVSRLFQKHLKISPIGWITHCRINRAKELLSTTQMPIAQVAKEVGIADPFYFSKLFKKQTAFSPLVYRNRTVLI